MKLIKVSELESLLGAEATARLVGALTEKRAKPPKKLPRYDVAVTFSVRRHMDIAAANKNLACEAAISQWYNYVEDDDEAWFKSRARRIKDATAGAIEIEKKEV